MAWYGNLVLGNAYDAAEFLDVQSYPNLLRWARDIAERQAVQRGRIVNRSWGEEWEQVPERHSADDIDQALAKQPK
ncbi:glutathione S-transferase [Vibrio ponticus]|nr:glutathione S-transferase [Vibrio ponticus]